MIRTLTKGSNIVIQNKLQLSNNRFLLRNITLEVFNQTTNHMTLRRYARTIISKPSKIALKHIKNSQLEVRVTCLHILNKNTIIIPRFCLK